MSPTDPLVTAVVVTYDGAALLPDCLESLHRQTVADRIRVVVVDNASHDDTLGLLRERYPWVQVVASPTNTGFAGGNNLGFARATTPYLLLLNSDARAAEDCVERLLAAAQTPGAERVAAFSPTVLLAQRFSPAADPDDPAAVVAAGGEVLVPDDTGDVRLVNSTGGQVTTDGYGVDRGWLEIAGTHRPDGPAFGLCGAAVLLRREAVAESRGFDERFFMYYEDTDLSWRLRRAGWEFGYVPDAQVDHIHAATSGEGSDLFHLHNDRNRLLMLVKNASAGLALRCTARALLTIGSTVLRRREPRHRTWLRVRSFSSFLRLLPAALAARHRPVPAGAPSRRSLESLLVDNPAHRRLRR